MKAVAKIVCSALFLALATTAAEAAHEAPCAEAHPTSALVARASAPYAMGGGHGDASFQVPFAGRWWRVALAWSSAGGHTRAGVVITERADDSG
jgi:hypothetical protein